MGECQDTGVGGTLRTGLRVITETDFPKKRRKMETFIEDNDV